jgi:hypothetical protein
LRKVKDKDCLPSPPATFAACFVFNPAFIRSSAKNALERNMPGYSLASPAGDWLTNHKGHKGNTKAKQ